MRYYFLALGALVVVCMGCAGVDGQSVLKSNEYVAPPAAMMQHPGPMVDGPGPGVMGVLAQPGGMGMGPGMGMPQMWIASLLVIIQTLILMTAEL